MKIKKIGNSLLLGMGISSILFVTIDFFPIPFFPRVINNIIEVITLVIFLALSVSFIISIVYVDEKERTFYKQRQDLTKKKLSSEPKKVRLISGKVFNEEEFKCEAKIDETEKILVKVNLNFTAQFDNYEDFSKFFYFPDSTDDEGT